MPKGEEMKMPRHHRTRWHFCLIKNALTFFAQEIVQTGPVSDFDRILNTIIIQVSGEEASGTMDNGIQRQKQYITFVHKAVAVRENTKEIESIPVCMFVI